MHAVKAYLKQSIYKDYELTIASADASFRKYYRLTYGDKSVLLMDASLEKESLAPFIDVTQRLLDANVKVPHILDKNIEAGFLIIEDFGNTHYLNVLNTNNYITLYKQALHSILSMQRADARELPLYDKAFLHFEMDLMQEWYLKQHLKIALTPAQKEIIAGALDTISSTVLEQPQDVFVHRDFHSRNIMLTPENEVAVIDYQDAMSGAITYDLVSLLKDCYIEFERAEIEKLVLEFRDLLKLKTEDKTFIKWFDFMGLQRHIKVLGIFSRLYLRDGKDGYLKDIPLTLKYVLETSARYEETQAFYKLLKELTS